MITPPTDTIRRLLPPGSVVLGPMAGITEAPFRGICKRMGATLTCTEMVSALGLHYSPDAAISRSLLTFSAEEVPCAVQLFGHDPQIMAEQAVGIVERYGADVALIDINMGCPVSKVVCKGSGAALMRTPELAATIVREVSSACELPVTVKFRSGWEAGERNAVEFARAMEAAGASAMCIHGRTRSQFYKGRADWETIEAVKAAVEVPVIGSGDVFSAGDVISMFERTGVDGVMVARGAQGNPWIFREARALIDTGEAMDPPTAFERIDMAREHAAALVAFAGERAFARMRKHVAWYIYGMPGATRMRERVNQTESYAALDELLLEFRQYVATRVTRPPDPTEGWCPMRNDVVLTVTGPDRVGIVETVTGVLLGLGANVETSRMARLGGEFAIIMLAAVPDASAEAVEAAFEDLIAEGYRATVVPTGRETGTAQRGWLRYRIEVHGADHEGIVHEIARGLSARGINVEAMDTGTSPAPVTGTTLFSMTAVVAVPPDLAEPVWTADLHEAGRRVNVGVVVTPVDAG